MNDLFETPELIPDEIINILNQLNDNNTYIVCEQVLKQIEPLGFTFEYGLDAEPYNLRRI